MATKFSNVFAAAIASAVFATAGVSQAQPYLLASVGLSEPTGEEFSAAGAQRIGAGYRFHESFALEVGLSEQGAFGGNGDNEFELSSTEFVAVATMPLGLTELFLKAGQHRWEVETEGAGAGFQNNQTGGDMLLGLGVGFVLEDQGAIKAEYNHYRIEESTSVNTFWLTFEARF